MLRQVLGVEIWLPGVCAATAAACGSELDCYMTAANSVFLLLVLFGTCVQLYGVPGSLPPVHAIVHRVFVP